MRGLRGVPGFMVEGVSTGQVSPVGSSPAEIGGSLDKDRKSVYYCTSTLGDGYPNLDEQKITAGPKDPDLALQEAIR